MRYLSPAWSLGVGVAMFAVLLPWDLLADFAGAVKPLPLRTNLVLAILAGALLIIGALGLLAERLVNLGSDMERASQQLRQTRHLHAVPSSRRQA